MLVTESNFASTLASHRARLLDEQSPSAGYHTWRAMHRAALIALTARAVILAASQRSFYPSVVHIRLGNLEPVNDWYGRCTGDALLNRAAEVLRESLPDGAVATRVGGVDFAVLVFAHGDQEQVVELAQHLLTVIGGPHEINGRSLSIGVRMGVSHGRPGVPVRDLVSAASTAADQPTPSAITSSAITTAPTKPAPTEPARTEPAPPIISQRRASDAETIATRQSIEPTQSQP